MGMIYYNGQAYSGGSGSEVDLNNIDAKTVNGYTVESNVPVDAKFTDTLNSDVLVEGSTVTIENLQSNVPFSEITVRGKNVFDIASGTATRCTAGINNNTITLTPTVMDGTASAYYQVPILLKKGQTVTISGKFENNSGNAIQLGVLKIPEATTSFAKGEETTATSGNMLLTYTPDNDYSDAVFSLYARVNGGVSAGSVAYTDIQIEYNSVATDYVTPITGKDIAIDINGTVHTVTPDRVPYTIPDVIYQQSGVNTVSVTGDGEPSLSIVGVREDKSIEKLWNREIPVYDDSEIKEGVATLETSLENKLDTDGNIERLKYSKIDFYNFAMSTENNPQLDENYKGKLLDLSTISGIPELSSITCIKEIDNVIYIGGDNGFGYLDNAMSTYTPICSYTGMRVADIVIATKNPANEITRWTIARINQKPCFYDVESDSVIEYNYDTASLGYTFFPTRIYADYSENKENPTLFYIDNNMANKIGTSKGIDNYIRMNYDFSSLGNTVNDVCIIDKYNTALIAYGGEILFRQDEGTLEEWHQLTDGAIAVTLPWSDPNMTIQKLYYEETTNEVYVFVSNTMEIILFKIDLGTMLNYTGWVEEGIYQMENKPYLPFTEITTDSVIFGYNGHCYLLANQLFMLTDENNVERGMISNVNFACSYSKDRAFSPVWIYNKTYNAFYFVDGNSGRLELLKIEYDKSDGLVNDALNTSLTEIDLLKQKIKEQESIIQNLEERMAMAGF